MNMYVCIFIHADCTPITGASNNSPTRRWGALLIGIHVCTHIHIQCAARISRHRAIFLFALISLFPWLALISLFAWLQESWFLLAKWSNFRSFLRPGQSFLTPGRYFGGPGRHIDDFWENSIFSEKQHSYDTPRGTRKCTLCGLVR